jgi:hypothetical protein
MDRNMPDVDRRLLGALSEAERGLGQIFVAKSDTKASNAQRARDHLSRCIAGNRGRPARAYVVHRASRRTFLLA